MCVSRVQGINGLNVHSNKLGKILLWTEIFFIKYLKSAGTRKPIFH